MTSNYVTATLTSHMTIPNEKMSTFSSYTRPFIISGAIQYGLPTTVYLFRRFSRHFRKRDADSPTSGDGPGLGGVTLIDSTTTRARPKSATTTVPSWEKKKSGQGWWGHCINQ